LVNLYSVYRVYKDLLAFPKQLQLLIKLKHSKSLPSIISIYKEITSSSDKDTETSVDSLKIVLYKASNAIKV